MARARLIKLLREIMKKMFWKYTKTRADFNFPLWSMDQQTDRIKSHTWHSLLSNADFLDTIYFSYIKGQRKFSHFPVDNSRFTSPRKPLFLFLPVNAFFYPENSSRFYHAHFFIVGCFGFLHNIYRTSFSELFQ